MSTTRSSTVDDVLRRSALRFPRRAALHFADRTWTYADLDDAVTRAAATLLALGLQKGDRVATYGRNSDAYLIAFLAAARAGLVHVPINYALTGDELGYLLEQSGSRLVLVDPALADRLPGAGVEVEQVMSLRDAPGSLLTQASSGPLPVLDVDVSDTDLVQLLYTSGTTSRPKGAMMTHRALVHEYVSSVLALECHEDDDPLHPMPLYHSAGMHVFLMPYLSVGATNRLLETPDIPEVLRRIEEDRLGAVFLAPTVWVPLSQHPDLATRDLSSLRKAFYGASIMPGPVLERLQERLPELGIYNCFGQSEIGPLATVLGPAEHKDRPESCGRSVLFVEIRVVDETGNDVETGGTGEVIYRSPQLCEGYWEKPEATAEAFRDGWFHSGDLVRIDDEGYITVVDRIKDVINTGGVLVASREVEDALYTHPAVAEVAVIGTPDDRWIEAVTAFVVLKEPATEADLIAYAKGRLAGYKVPKHVHLVDALPRNASGKLLKRVLRDEVPQGTPA
ncbi:AMP-binding protein [Pseudonocardia sp. RS11V-5]|uniref:fatty acyl-CoA synthetase n=1 Tax=Pseudonocardia terrae TaxID=2905831 RepID=UPI001E576545|nr:fatty acyl-CoA synthetase [Pseudonocardia terrae]MCE3552890.1 AMP-binding protein [Pseudonocardia terrae]